MFSLRYDGAYGDDPSTDNPFGREDLAGRRTPLLQEFLRRGGSLSDFARLNAECKARIRLTEVLDCALNKAPKLGAWADTGK